MPQKYILSDMLKTDALETSRKHNPVMLLEDSIRTSSGCFSETVKHSTTNFLVFSYNTFDEVTLAKYDSNPFYKDAGI